MLLPGMGIAGPMAAVGGGAMASTIDKDELMAMIRNALEPEKQWFDSDEQPLTITGTPGQVLGYDAFNDFRVNQMPGQGPGYAVADDLNNAFDFWGARNQDASLEIRRIDAMNNLINQLGGNRGGRIEDVNSGAFIDPGTGEFNSTVSSPPPRQNVESGFQMKAPSSAPGMQTMANELSRNAAQTGAVAANQQIAPAYDTLRRGVQNTQAQASQLMGNLLARRNARNSAFDTNMLGRFGTQLLG